MTPQMQASMRTTQTKALTRGRKKGSKKNKGHGKRGKKSTLTRKATKQNLVKKGLREKKSASKPHPSAAKTTKKAKTGDSVSKGPKRKAKEDATNEDKPRNKSAERFQERFQQSGKGWVYRVLPEQQYGCSNCRYIFAGCANCRKPSFRGKSAAVMRAEQEAAEINTEGSWDGWGDWEDWDESWYSGGTKTDTKKSSKSKKSRSKK